jgi:hypothetical protein
VTKACDGKNVTGPTISEEHEVYCEMKMWTEIRRLVLTEKKSKRAICQEYRIHWKTLEKILAHEEPPGYQQKQPRHKPKLEAFLPIVHEILEQDKGAPPKQRHTIKRITAGESLPVRAPLLPGAAAE